MTSMQQVGVIFAGLIGGLSALVTLVKAILDLTKTHGKRGWWALLTGLALAGVCVGAILWVIRADPPQKAAAAATAAPVEAAEPAAPVKAEKSRHKTAPLASAPATAVSTKCVTGQGNVYSENYTYFGPPPCVDGNNNQVDHNVTVWAPGAVPTGAPAPGVKFAPGITDHTGFRSSGNTFIHEAPKAEASAEAVTPPATDQPR